jgi:hypothetical protein
LGLKPRLPDLSRHGARAGGPRLRPIFGFMRATGLSRRVMGKRITGMI